MATFIDLHQGQQLILINVEAMQSVVPGPSAVFLACCCICPVYQQLPTSVRHVCRNVSAEPGDAATSGVGADTGGS